DLAYYGNQGQIEYDFIVSPGADPSKITLNFAGANNVNMNPQGDLVVHTAVGDITQKAPAVYQTINGTRQEIPSSFILHPSTASVGLPNVTFSVGNYDHSQPLVIDPLVLGYSTYLGGAKDDFGRGVAVDGKGAAYVVGQTHSGNFPTTPGTFDTSFNGG